jgi:hypothetical protein
MAITKLSLAFDARVFGAQGQKRDNRHGDVAKRKSDRVIS